MKIKFYPYDFDYKIKAGKIYLYLFSKLEDGKKVCLIDQYKPYFYAKVENIDPTELEKKLKSLTIEFKGSKAKVVDFKETEKELLGKKVKLWQIFVNYPTAVPPLAKEIQSWGIECYEKDILFVHRYLRDKKIIPLTLTEAEGQFSNGKELSIPTFKVKSVKSIDIKKTTNWKILSIDIETYAKKKEIDPERNPILMIAFYDGKNCKKVITWKNFSKKEDNIEVVADEAALLKRFLEIVKEEQPDILTGYFSDGFDLPYIKARADKYKLNLNLGLDGSLLQINSRGGFRASEAKIKGISHIDILKFIKYIFGLNLKTDTYSLDAVAEELLGHKKHDVDLSKLADVWDNEPEKLDVYCAYNLHDARLTFRLCQKLLPDIIEFAKILALPPYDLIRMRFSRLVESYILKRAVEENVLAPNRPGNTEISQRMEESIQGAFVYEPTPGLYKNLVVLDFRSLYPTIIISHNIGPESFQCTCCKDKTVPERENYWFCQKEKKFIPSVLGDLVLRRLELKKQIKAVKAKNESTAILDASSYALKTLANSFYGYLGFYGARWYCLECAASTTAYARHYIKKTISEATTAGFKVIYADTDSCFLLLDGKDISEAKKFMQNVNQTLPGQMELEYEGHFSRGIFVALKGRLAGAKKKYALLQEDGKIKITGFETVRRNWSPLVKRVQEELLRLVLGDKQEEALQYVKDIVSDLKSGLIPLEELILNTQITRDLSQYSALGPHVLVARKLAAAGERIIPGTVIQYIIAKGSGLVRDRAKVPSEVKEREYDADYYLYHQLLPAVSSILAVLGISEEQILGKSEQTGLGNYF